MNTLKHYGYTHTETPHAGETPACIIAVHRDRYELVTEAGFAHGKLKTSSYYGSSPQPFPTVGDFVFVKETLGNDYLITKTLPRKSYFSRLDPSPGGFTEQAIAANFDTVFIMQSLNQNFNLRRLERYLTLTWQSGATPVIVLTKIDLIDDPTPLLEDARAIASGVDIVAISSVTGYGLKDLEKYLQPDKVCIFLGSSGVGKSSLLNALMGEDVMLVKEIREDDAMGRHTTTHRQLFTLPCGTHIIDTPGMRELGMWERDDSIKDSVSGVFADIEEKLGNCRFSNCLHQSEPGCIIREAIDLGEIDSERWESYQKLQREALYAENKHEAIRQKSARNKDIAVWSKSRRKAGKVKW